MTDTVHVVVRVVHWDSLETLCGEQVPRADLLQHAQPGQERFPFPAGGCFVTCEACKAALVQEALEGSR